MGFFDSSAGGIVGGAASLVGSAIASRNSLKAQREVNEMNYKIWGEQRQHNIDMFNMQNQANIDMWNMQNAYNDPSAQIERLSAAGLNPYLVMGNNPSGVATNAPATGTMNPSPAPTMQAPPYEAFDIGLDKAVGRVMEGLDLKSRMDISKVQSDYLLEQINDLISTRPYRINNLDSDTGKNDASAKLDRSLAFGQDIQNMVGLQTIGDDVMAKRFQNNVLSAQGAILSMDRQKAEFLNQWLGIDKVLSVAQEIYAIFSSDMTLQEARERINLIKADTMKSIKEAGYTVAKTEATITGMHRDYWQGENFRENVPLIQENVRGKKVENDIAESSFDDLTRRLAARWKLDEQLIENDYQKAKNIGDFGKTWIGKQFYQNSDIIGDILNRTAGGVLSGSGSLNSSSSRSNSVSHSFGQNHSIVDSYIHK